MFFFIWLFVLIRHIRKKNIIDCISYNIILKIKGIGTKKIFYEYFQHKYYPNEVYINGNYKSPVTYSYDLNQTDNKIELVWYNLIDNCKSMFYNCINITEIDLPNFDTSQVTSMDSMFGQCKLLTSLNLANFNTSKVTDMYEMFYYCESLFSLNLSNFDISKVTRISETFYS